MKILKVLRISGTALFAVGLVGIGVGVSAPSSLIIAVGVRGLSAISTVSGVVLGTGIAAATGGTVPAIISSVKKKNETRLLESRHESDMKNLSEYAKDSLNPEKTRVRLEQLRKNNPNLSELVDSCLEQMDKINTYQARHKSLIAANEAIYLQDTILLQVEEQK